MSCTLSSSPSTAPSTPRLHALDLSEIRSLIAQHLTKQDLAHCILVSQSWSQSFLPNYWHTVSVSSHKLARCHASALEHHGRHVRWLSAGRIKETSVFNQLSISRLQRLEVSTCEYREDDGRECLQEIVQRNQSTLVSFSWRCLGRDTSVGRPFRLWIPMLSGLDKLVEVELSNWSFSRLDFVRVLIECPVLRRVKLVVLEELVGNDSGRVDGYMLTNGNSNSDGNTTTNNSDLPHGDESSLLTFQHGRLQRIEFSGTFMPSLLHHVPTIEQLHLTHIRRGANYGRVAHQLNDLSHFSSLAHLTTFTEWITHMDYMKLVGITSHLVHFEGLVPSLAMNDFLKLILQEHAGTMEHLVVLNEGYEPSFTQFNMWQFLESCPQLVTLEISFPLDQCMAHKSLTDNTEKYFEPTKEWACHSLRRLQLRIRDMDPKSPMYQIPFDLCVDRLFPPEGKRDNKRRTRTALERLILERLSELEKLEHLHIGSGWYKLPAMTHAHGSGG